MAEKTLSRSERQLKVAGMIAQGLRDTEIINQLGMSRSTFYRDLQKIRLIFGGSDAQNYAMLRAVSIRDSLLRMALMKAHSIRTDEGQLKAIQVASNLLTDLEKTYERVGLIPSIKYSDENTADEMHPLTRLKLEAIKSLEKERKDEEKAISNQDPQLDE